MRLIDTAGFDDPTTLGASRIRLTQQAAQQADLAVIVCSPESAAAAEDGTEPFAEEKRWYDLLQKKNTPVVVVCNKTDLPAATSRLTDQIAAVFQTPPIQTSAVAKEGIAELRQALTAAAAGLQDAQRMITGDLVTSQDLVLLVMPQDIQAPKGRLILPQVQTLRELLDKKCLTMCTTTDQFEQALAVLAQPPRLIITDSQAFQTIYERKPQQSRLTSFSTLFAAYKGDISYFVQGARTIAALTEQDKVLIAECCTHAPLEEDIGRVKLPRLLRKRIGEGLTIDLVSGMDFPGDLSAYRLVIQCGACMFNRKYVMSRVNAAKAQKIPMTNYGVAIAYLNGILDKVELTR